MERITTSKIPNHFNLYHIGHQKAFNLTLLSSIDVIKPLHMRIMDNSMFWGSQILQPLPSLVASPILS